jgi:hypothetical protein
VLSKISSTEWTFLALFVWGGVILGTGILGTGPYGITEGGARALLLTWSASDQIVTSIVFAGTPDLRALLFLPLTAFWTGSILAGKTFTLITAFFGAALFYQWSKASTDDETALIATGLLLFSPLILTEIDSISVGPYLLLVFGLGIWMNKVYRAGEKEITGWYFIQLLVIAISVSLHPMGLAYPLSLAWQWFKEKEPANMSRRKKMLIAIGITSTIVLVMRIGWVGIEWFNPVLNTLGYILMGANANNAMMPNWSTGIIPAVLLLIVLVADYRYLLNKLSGTMLLLAMLIGALCADASWALIVLTFVLYRGLPLLIKFNSRSKKTGLLAQRGLVLITIFIAAIWFMQVDKNNITQNKAGLISPQDQIIQSLAAEAADKDAPFRAASQWPGRTMLASKRDVLPLPPAKESGEALLKTLTGITHIIFDHRDIENKPLATNLAELGGRTETKTLEEGGVIIKIRTNNTLHNNTHPKEKQPAINTDPEIPQSSSI